MSSDITIFIDADGCPVVDATIKIANRAQIKCVIICNTAHVFQKEGATTVTVPKGKDSVDFVLVNMIKKGDVVVTQDYGLAAMCLAREAIPIRQDGFLYTAANIDMLLMQRHTASQIRKSGKNARGLSSGMPRFEGSFEASLRKLLNMQNERGCCKTRSHFGLGPG